MKSKLKRHTIVGKGGGRERENRQWKDAGGGEEGSPDTHKHRLNTNTPEHTDFTHNTFIHFCELYPQTHALTTPARKSMNESSLESRWKRIK